MSIVKMLKGHELFQSLGFDEVERVSTFSGLKDFEKGEQVFRTGTFGSHFFVLLEGSVNLRLPAEAHEASLIVARIEKGDMFGISPLLGSGRHTTTAECATGCRVLAIEGEPLRSLLEEQSLIGLQVMNVVASAYFSRYLDALNRLQKVVNEIGKAA